MEECERVGKSMKEKRNSISKGLEDREDMVRLSCVPPNWEV